MVSEAARPILDVFVFHSLRLTTEAWYAIADRYDHFLNPAVDDRRHPGAWGPPQPSEANWPTATDGAFDPYVHRLLAEPLPHRISRRVDRYQHVDQFGLASFSDVGRLRLSARSYSLAINNHKQCMLIFHFSFAATCNDETLDDAALADEIVTIARDRQVYRNIAQEGYVQKALDDAVDEIRQNFADNVRHHRAGDQVVLARPDFAFPIFVCDGVGPRVATIFEQEEDARLETPAPVYFGWNYGLVCGRGADVTRESLAVFAFMQFSYHQLRQYEGFLNREMERTSLRSRAIDTEKAASIVGNLTHTFEWFHLDFFRHLGTLNPTMFAIANELVERWRLNSSVSRMHGSMTYHRDYAVAEYSRAAQRDTGRQEAILFLIALLQLFALISVLVDFQSLHGIAQDTRKLLDPGLGAWEWWGLQHIGTIPRLILILAVGLALAFYGPKLIRRGRLLLLEGTKAALRRSIGMIRSLRRRWRFVDRRLILRHSTMHGLGVFPLFGFREGETVLRIDAGDAKTDLAATEQDAEWNYRDGVYFVRRERTAYGFINHSRVPNARAVLRDEGGTAILEVTALRRIARTDEILIDYREENLPFSYLRDDGGYL
jgi:hypothetical protein